MHSFCVTEQSIQLLDHPRYSTYGLVKLWSVLLAHTGRHTMTTVSPHPVFRSDCVLVVETKSLPTLILIPPPPLEHNHESLSQDRTRPLTLSRPDGPSTLVTRVVTLSTSLV